VAKGTKIPWAGYAPLRPGRIHLYCVGCGRKVSNVFRYDYDPPRAELVQTWCDKHDGKDPPEHFLDGDGKEIPWEEIEANIEHVTRRER
jgi:hypothetical protein